MSRLTAHSATTGSDATRTGYLLVGHGTRRQAGQQQLAQVFDEFRQLLAPRPTAYAFLELAEPDIAAAISQLAMRGVQQIVTVPVLLFSAGHAQRDIPEAVADAARQHGLNVLRQIPALECSRPMLELSAQRFRETVCRAGVLPGLSPSCRNCCLGAYCQQTALVMIGRGSGSSTATAQMREFTRRRAESTPVAWVRTAFIHAQQPSVSDALDEMSTTDFPLAVVQPHLLFEGELIDQLRREVAERQLQQRNRKWLISMPLGTDASLARTLAEVALTEGD